MKIITAAELRNIANARSYRVIMSRIIKAAYQGKFELYLGVVDKSTRVWFINLGYHFKESQLNPGEYVISRA